MTTSQNPRPVQRPAMNSEARKRWQEQQAAAAELEADRQVRERVMFHQLGVSQETIDTAQWIEAQRLLEEHETIDAEEAESNRVFFERLRENAPEPNEDGTVTFPVVSQSHEPREYDFRPPMLHEDER